MKKIHQSILGLAFAFLACFNSMAQQPDFLYYYPFWDENYAGTHSLELTTNDGQETEFFFVAICDFTRTWYSLIQDYPAKIIKLSPAGVPLGELMIGEEGHHTIIDRLYHAPFDPHCILAMGRTFNKDGLYYMPFLAKFDKDLNIIWQRKIELPEEFRKYFYGAKTMMDSNGNIVFCTALYETNSQGVVNTNVHRLYLRLSSEGEVLSLNLSPETSELFFGGQGNFFEYADGSGDYGQEVVSGGITKVLRMNHDFEILDSWVVDHSLRLPLGTVFMFDFLQNFTISYPDGSLVLACDASYFEYSTMKSNDVVAVLKINSTDSIVNASFVGLANDSINRLANSQGGDGIGDKLYFCSSSYDKDGAGGIIEAPNRIIVTKTDANANIIWQRCYHDGVQMFNPFSVMATSDEGCLVTGNCGDGNTECNVFVLKFFSDGTLSVPEMEKFVRPYTYYPNPAQDELHLQFSPDVTPTQIELYDLQGRLVKTQRNGLESISLEGLASGTYTMRVMLEGGKVFSDKVVKE